MNNNGKNMRPTTVAFIVVYALAIASFVTAIILQATSIFDAAKIMFIIAPALFIAATVIAVIDTRLNPKLSDQEKSRITKGAFKALGCGAATLIILSIIPIIMIIGFWLIMIIAYGQGIS